ncbi:MAG: hypothetical protein KBT28_12385 [Bacteroidales bacterium]|nr:hypothetical protein [Candidatus Colimorpha merdihippi]
MSNQAGIDPQAQPNGGTQTDPTDWKSRARSWEAKSKENKAALDAANAELEQLRQYKERAEKAEGEAAKMRAAQERAEAVAKVAADKGLPANLIFGSTAEEMSANADAINEHIKSLQEQAASRRSSLFRDSGVPAGKPAADDKQAFVSNLFKHKE